jgi:hypothetical protein
LKDLGVTIESIGYKQEILHRLSQNEVNYQDKDCLDLQLLIRKLGERPEAEIKEFINSIDNADSIKLVRRLSYEFNLKRACNHRLNAIMGIKCKIHGCNRGPDHHGSYIEGFCHTHYQHYTAGNIDIDGRYPPCKIALCDRISELKGFCKTHYVQHSKGYYTFEGLPVEVKELPQKWSGDPKINAINRVTV